MPRPLYPQGKYPPVPHWIRSWMGPRDGLDDVEKTKLCVFMYVPYLFNDATSLAYYSIELEDDFLIISEESVRN
jgi:hypothetical protein